MIEKACAIFYKNYFIPEPMPNLFRDLDLNVEAESDWD